MTRSKRKTPKLAITCAESEKDDKRIAARRERARITSKLSVHAASEPDFDLVEHGDHPSHGHWGFAKDGKFYAGPVRQEHQADAEIINRTKNIFLFLDKYIPIL